MAVEEEKPYRVAPVTLSRVLSAGEASTAALAPLPLPATEWARAERGWAMTRGLPNLGNTCYLNSLLQVLLNTPAVAHVVGVETHECPRTCLTCDFLALRRTPRGQPSSPAALVAHIGALLPAFRPHRQQDPHELFLLLLERWDRRLRQPFEGALTSSVRCPRGHVSATAEPFLNLSLDICSARSLSAAVEGFFAPGGRVAGYLCARCGVRGPATKDYALRSAPLVLALQLLRFNARGEKVSRSVQLEERLRLGGESFELFGLVEHLGSGLGGGHYIAYVRAPNAVWHVADDSRVTPVSFERVKSAKPYLLFFLKKQAEVVASVQSSAVPQPVQAVMPSAALQSAPVVISSAATQPTRVVEAFVPAHVVKITAPSIIAESLSVPSLNEATPKRGEKLQKALPVPVLPTRRLRFGRARRVRLRLLTKLCAPLEALPPLLLDDRALADEFRAPPRVRDAHDIECDRGKTRKLRKRRPKVRLDFDRRAALN